MANPCIDDDDCKAANTAFLLAKSTAQTKASRSLSLCRAAKALATAAAVAAALFVAAATLAAKVCVAIGWWAWPACVAAGAIAAIAAIVAAAAVIALAVALVLYGLAKDECAEAQRAAKIKYDAMITACETECTPRGPIECAC